MYEVSQLECIDLRTDHLQDTELSGADSMLRGLVDACVYQLEQDTW
jgi:hypothetical protein